MSTGRQDTEAGAGDAPSEDGARRKAGTESLLSGRRLSRPMRRLLWTIAQHKYGWCYVPPSFGERRLTSAEALERRGLVTLDRERWTAAATDAGRAVIAELFPVSPFVLRTYDHQPGGWTPLDA